MKNIIFLIFAMFLTSSSCENLADKVYRIRVDNKSSQSIMVYANYILPDTVLSVQKPDNLKTILSGGFKDIYDHEIGDIGFNRLKNERITIFILSTDVVNSYSWDTIRNKYMILKRYEVKENDLVDDGAIIYP